jgi:hypothetical protein
LLTESWCSTATNAPERAKANRGDDATTNRERNEKLRANTDAAMVFGGGGLLWGMSSYDRMTTVRPESSWPVNQLK